MRRVGSGSTVRGRGVAALVLLGAGVIATSTCAPDPYDGYDGMPPPTRPATPPARPVVHVQARDNSFQEQEITVVAGTEVVWANVGRNDHDVVPTEFEDDPAAAPWGVAREAFRPRDVYSHVFDAPGTYVYVCTIHGVKDKGMAGTITVTA